MADINPLLDPKVSYRTFTIALSVLVLYGSVRFVYNISDPFLERMVEAVIFFFIGRESRKP